MHKIVQVESLATDAKTGATAKLVSTTAGDFHSRRCAYNQTFERLERTMLQYGGATFDGAIPVCVTTLRYLIQPHPKRTLCIIKDLTTARLAAENSPERKPFFDEMQRIRKIALTSTKVCLFYTQIPLAEWAEYTDDDIETIVDLQLQAELPHVCVPINPRWTDEQAITFIDNQINKLKAEQNIIGQFHPDMKKKDGKPVLKKLFDHTKVLGAVLTALTPASPSNLAYYAHIWNNAPKNKLMCASDVEDTFGAKTQKLSTHLALRRFEIDVSCRRVTIPLMGFNFPASPENTLIYDDNTGGMLAESDQLNWYGKSAVDFIMENFPANTGLSFREYVLAFNFVQLNRTGLRESKAILEGNHPQYNDQRAYLQAFWAQPDPIQ